MAASLDETRMEQDRGRPHCFSLFLRFPGSLAPWLPGQRCGTLQYSLLDGFYHPTFLDALMRNEAY